VKTVLIGGPPTLLGVLVVPTILVAGYVVRVLRGTVRGDGTPPRFDAWGDVRGFGRNEDDGETDAGRPAV